MVIGRRHRMSTIRQFPGELAGTATSLLLETGRPGQPGADVTAEVLNCVSGSIMGCSCDTGDLTPDCSRNDISALLVEPGALRCGSWTRPRPSAGTALGIDEPGRAAGEAGRYR